MLTYLRTDARQSLSEEPVQIVTDPGTRERPHDQESGQWRRGPGLVLHCLHQLGQEVQQLVTG